MLQKHSTCPQMVLSFRVITQEKSLKSNLYIHMPDELYSNALFPYFELLPSYVHSFNYLSIVEKNRLRFLIILRRLPKDETFLTGYSIES